MRSLSVLVMTLLVGVCTLQAQPIPEDWPEAAPEDVESVDAIMASVYDVISGPAGEARDWDRFRSLFHPNAQLAPIVQTQGGDVFPLYWSPEDYIERAGAQLEASGFFEVEIWRDQKQYGNLVHIFSTYESYRTAEDEAPFTRGINSFQLHTDGSRWYVVNITWQGETPAFPIPDQYLPE